MEQPIMTKVLLVIALLLTAVSVSYAQEPDASLVITGAWARPAVVETHVSAVYLTIENAGDAPRQLIDAATRIAGEVQIHESRMADGVMQMRQLEGLEIAPGEVVALEPGGYHLMLLDLQADLVVGEAISLELVFEAAEGNEPLTITIGVPVLDEAPPASPIVVLDAWARPTAILPELEATPEASMHGHDMSHETQDMIVTSDVTAVYMRLLNRGESDERLIAARADVAGMVEIHESRMQAGVMQMRPVEAINVRVNDVAVLEPGGLHIMFMAMQRGLIAGDAIVVTLIFESGLELPVAVPVRDNLSGQ
jgi:periplasmic copper chaperone A